MPDDPARPQLAYSPPERGRGWPARLDPVPAGTLPSPVGGSGDSRRSGRLSTGWREPLTAPTGGGSVPQISTERAAALGSGPHRDSAAGPPPEAARPAPRSAGHVRDGIGLPTYRYSIAAAVAAEEQHFLHRATGYLVERGMRQLLVAGGGPSTNEVPRVFRQVDPPLRMVHLAGGGLSGGLTRSLLADGAGPHEPGGISLQRLLSCPEADVLDRAEPMGVLLLGLLHLIPDRRESGTADPFDAVAGLVRQLAAGSYLALSHLSADGAAPRLQHALRVYLRGGLTVQLRDPAEIGRFFAGLRLVEPGVELISRWRPGRPPDPSGDGAGPAGEDRSHPPAPCYVGMGQL